MEKKDFWKNKVVDKLFHFWPEVKMKIKFLKQKVWLKKKNLVLVLKYGALIISEKFINFMYLSQKGSTGTFQMIPKLKIAPFITISMVFLTTLFTGVPCVWRERVRRSTLTLSVSRLIELTEQRNISLLSSFLSYREPRFTQYHEMGPIQ